MSNDNLRYPIGSFQKPTDLNTEQIESWIVDIKQLPQKVKELALTLSSKKLNTAYREGGWTARQVINHLPDSHMNSLMRFKLALTESSPIVKSYDESAWANLPDYKGDINPALNLLEALHDKWVILLKNMVLDHFKKTFKHPETNQTWTLGESLALYAWHGLHHLGHLEIISKSNV